MKRALVIEGSGNLWGSERALLDLLGSLHTLEVAVCCPAQMSLNGELERRQIRTLPYFMYDLHKRSRRQRLQAAAGVLRACVEFRPDVVYLNQCGSYKVTLPAATILDLPIVAHIRIFEDAAYLASKCPSPRRLRGIIAISSAVETEIRRFRQLDTIRLHRLYDGYAPSALALQGVSAQERIVNRIACVGRLVPIKGQDLLISALCKLKETGQTGECMFVGNGEDGFVHDLRQMAARGNPSFAIQWLGFVSDVLSLLHTCSVLVCPSHNEPLGRVILEAWDAGVVPVAFSGSGGAAEIVAAAQGGILYDEQNPSSLAKALCEALELDPKGREQLVNNGRNWMFRNCDPQTYGKAISTILTNAA
jgi:glycosyltransferase involved in cell wall biosynthesis